MKDLSKLPKDIPHPANPPTKSPLFAPVIAQSWAKAAEATWAHAPAAETPFRASWATMCGRKISYLVEGVLPSNPMTLADHWRTGLGHQVHDWFAQYIEEAFGADWTVESETVIASDDMLCSGHLDIFLVRKDPVEGKPNRVLLELKSINGFGFKMISGARGPAQGPRLSAFVQGCLYAKMHNADMLAIVYLATELLSPREATKVGADDLGRFCAEWHYAPATFEPVADEEFERMRGIQAAMLTGQTVPRNIVDSDVPPGAVVSNPTTGLWVVRDEAGLVTDSGSTWQCDYCSMRDKCLEDGE